MYKSKLIRLYQTLDDSEVRQLKKWVKSPIHNKHKDVQALFEFIFTRQGITTITTQRERAYKYLYSKEKLNMARLRHVMSFATEVLESFIRYKEYVSDDKNTKLVLLSALRKRKLKKEAQQQMESTRKVLAKEAVQNEKYYWIKYQLEVEQFRMDTDGDRPAKTNLQDVMNSSSNFFVLSTLRYALESIAHQNLFKTKYTVPFLEPILQAIEAGEYADIKSIQLYYACYLSFTQPDDDKPYELLKDYLVRYPNILPHKEFREVYNIALNYCIKRLNKGSVYYIEEAFDLYMNGIASEVLLDNGYLSHFAYKNIVAIGLNLEKFEQIEEFIPRGDYLLHPDYRESYVHYNRAKFNFATKNYKDAVRLLVQMEYDDLFMTLDAKMMLLKIYVAEDDFDLVDSYIHSFTQFLRRKSGMSYHQKGYLNTVRLTQKVVNAFTKEEKKAIAAEIEKTDPLPEKKWLMEQLNS